MASNLVTQLPTSEPHQMSPDHHLPKEQHTKLRECTNRVIPLCAAILVIFSIGGGLGYTFNQQALPRNAVVGISITFLALGLAFGIGWLKIHHSTHESHISRLEAARSAYERIRQDTGKLHNPGLQAVRREPGRSGLDEP